MQKIFSDSETQQFELCTKHVECFDCTDYCKGNLSARCEVLDDNELAECSSELIDSICKFQAIYNVVFNLAHSTDTDLATKAILDDQVDSFVAALNHLTIIQNRLYPNLAIRAQESKKSRFTPPRLTGK